jgi:hypothetical protein
MSSFGSNYSRQWVFNTSTMKLQLMILLTGISALFVHAQTTNTAPKASLRLQTIVKRDGAPTTNAPSQVGTNIGKPSAQRQVKEFIGTLLAVDKQKQTVSIASGAPAKADRNKATLLFLTPETKLFNGEVPATLDHAVIGQEVHYGLRIRREDGKQEITVLRFLPSSKQEGKR